MLNDKKAERILKSDYCRVLVTETAPYETPLIFSNDCFYNIAKNLRPIQASPIQLQTYS